MDGEIVKGVYKILEELGVILFEEGEYSLLELDSLTFINLIFNIEEKFSISINYEDLLKENFDSVDHICNILEKYGIK